MSTDDIIGGYDSDESVTSTTTCPSEGGPTRFLDRLHHLELSTAHCNVLKCSVVYLITSLFTFSPYLSGFISDLTSQCDPGEHKPSSSGHMVATM